MPAAGPGFVAAPVCNHSPCGNARPAQNETPSRHFLRKEKRNAARRRTCAFPTLLCWGKMPCPRGSPPFSVEGETRCDVPAHCPSAFMKEKRRRRTPQDLRRPCIVHAQGAGRTGRAATGSGIKRKGSVPGYEAGGRTSRKTSAFPCPDGRITRTAPVGLHPDCTPDGNGPDKTDSDETDSKRTGRSGRNRRESCSPATADGSGRAQPARNVLQCLERRGPF